MFAIIRSGGRQYKVTPEATLKVNRLPGKVGEAVVFEDVLMLNDGQKTSVGTPFVSGVKVQAKIVEHARDDKIIVFKKKRRQNYRRKAGHRQDITLLQITDVAGVKKAVKSDKKEAAAPEAKKETKKAEAPKKATEAKNTDKK